MEHGAEKLDPMAKLEEAIRTSPEKLKAKHQELNGNSWMACFIDRLQAVSIRLDKVSREKLIDVRAFQKAQEQLDVLENRVKQLLQIPAYKEKDFLPPPTLEKELFSELDILPLLKS